MDNKKNNRTTSEEFKDNSRFTRWINNLDERDKSLSPGIRRSKWILSLIGLFLLFGLSFIWLPSIKISREHIEAPVLERKTSIEKESALPTFEMPVDSFENHLKRSIHENIPEKE